MSHTTNKVIEALNSLAEELADNVCEAMGVKDGDVAAAIRSTLTAYRPSISRAAAQQLASDAAAERRWAEVWHSSPKHYPPERAKLCLEMAALYEAILADNGYTASAFDNSPSPKGG